MTHPWIQNYDAGINWHMPINPKPVFALLDETAAKYGERPAFDFLDKKYTWGEIAALSDRFAAGLQRMGVTKGQKIGLFLPNCPYFLIAYYGILKNRGQRGEFQPALRGKRNRSSNR